ncbi:MAG: NAD-dependent DNA ligase LigA [Pseudobutyrivibrio sp.]|nr:NAD-dependent DNA ligase LigA [Pseudobutyrivibrio sp.]
MEEKNKIEELVEKLNQASDAYYNDKDEIMSNYEWDAMFDELVKLEEETGYILPDSPTQKTGADESIGEGNREAHEYPALSLKKSKNVSDLQKWAGDRPIWLSWKLDGITLVATYDNGKLTKLMTRGNGSIGTNITYLAAYISGLPEKLSYQGHMVVRGEAVISYDDFNRLNDMIDDSEESYANPRNLVAGTLSLDSKRASEVKDRCVSFNAFTLVHIDDEMISWGERMNFLSDMKFNVVDREATSADKLQETIDKWTKIVRSGQMNLPVDGLVITFDDTDFAQTGSVTGHHATNAGMAFKWQDTAATTTLDHVEWSCAMSTISPVAVFDVVNLEGTEVRRASLCNISEMRRLGIGADRKTSLKVIKSNMIIPKVIEADGHGTDFEIPKECPVCGFETKIWVSDKTEVETLHCTNPNCAAKHLVKYTRFVSKSGMDIDGLSEKTINKFINEKYIVDFADIYDIANHKADIIQLEGFGEKSYANIIQSIENRRTIEPVNFIFALCIPMIGLDAAKKIISTCGTDGFMERLNNDTGFEDIDGIGVEKSNSIRSWYMDENNRALFEKLLTKVELKKVEATSITDGKCMGLTFCITGNVNHYKNRQEFVDYVESQGGNVTGSVSKKTNYLVNNDNASQSNKNLTAIKNGIPIITEEEFLNMFG